MNNLTRGSSKRFDCVGQLVANAVVNEGSDAEEAR